MIVYVKAELRKIYVETGEIDVAINNGGEDVVITVDPEDVTAIATEHKSDCDTHSERQQQRFCTCGIMPYQYKGNLKRGQQ